MVCGGPELARAPHYSRGVLRPSSLSRALAGVGAAVLTALSAAVGLPATATSYAASATPPDPKQPLVLRMHSITPDYIPSSGPITIRGTITNDSDEPWTAINVEAFVGSDPITTTAGLAAAAETPVDADVGHRIADPGTFAHLDSLAPGESDAVRAEGPALEDQSDGPRRLLVRRPRARRDRRGAQLQRGRPRPHVPPPRARLGDQQRAGGADLPRPPAPSRRHPRARRQRRGHRQVAEQPPVRRAERRGRERTGSRRPAADLGARPRRGRRRTTARGGQPRAHPGRSDAREPRRRSVAEPLAQRVVVGIGCLDERQRRHRGLGAEPGRPTLAPSAPPRAVGQHRAGSRSAVRRPRGRLGRALRPAPPARGDASHRAQPHAVAGADDAGRRAAGRPDVRPDDRRPAAFEHGAPRRHRRPRRGAGRRHDRRPAGGVLVIGRRRGRARARRPAQLSGPAPAGAQRGGAEGAR